MCRKLLSDRSHPQSCLVLATLGGALLWGSRAATADGEGTADLFEMNIQELMNLEVKSAAKSAKPLAQTAAAVTVISQEDIRRSGANNIPDLLRFVPGLQVAQMSNNHWAISARGFNGTYSNKLLVMIDGRSIYNPVYGGVYWDQQNLVLQDIERIEIVRGPGATLWGSNAVNGIINIITKSAADTQGGLISGGGGNQETGFGSARYGGKLTDDAYYRVYAKHNTRDNFDQVSDPSPRFGTPASFANKDNNDRSQDNRGGFRLDWSGNADDNATVSGDFYQGSQNYRVTMPTFSLPFIRTFDDTVRTSGENLLGRWKHKFNNDLVTETQLYWDHYRREAVTGIEDVHTYDLDTQANYRFNDWNEIVVGGGYRYMADDLVGSDIVFYSTQRRKISNFNLFIQDDITLLPNTLNLLVGTKYEHNGFSGSQAQPTGRLMWTIDEHQHAWAAVSHAVRSAVRTDQNLNINFQRFTSPFAGPFCFGAPGTRCESRIIGNPGFGSEKEDSFELGYRVSPHHDFSLDVAGFYNRYRDLATSQWGMPFIEQDVMVTPYRRMQYGRAESYGLELSAQWQVTRDWRLSANYTHLQLLAHHSSLSNDRQTETELENRSPENQWALRSLYNLTDRIEFDSTLYYVDNLLNAPVMYTGVNPASYYRLDARIGWAPLPNLELDLVGQNLLDNRHLEYIDNQGVVPSEVPRSIFARAQWKF